MVPKKEINENYFLYLTGLPKMEFNMGTVRNRIFSDNGSKKETKKIKIMKNVMKRGEGPGK